MKLDQVPAITTHTGLRGHILTIEKHGMLIMLRRFTKIWGGKRYREDSKFGLFPDEIDWLIEQLRKSK